jgi:hypothetical protein
VVSSLLWLGFVGFGWGGVLGFGGVGLGWLGVDEGAWLVCGRGGCGVAGVCDVPRGGWLGVQGEHWGCGG